MKNMIIAFSLVGMFIFAPVTVHPVDISIDSSVVQAFDNGDCTHDETGMVYCNFTDKDILQEWIDTYPVTLEQRIKELEVEAGKPQAILRKVCRDQGFEGDDCPSTLFGMAMQESRMGKYMIGDSGRSEGFFHILDIHKLSDDCKYSLPCSAAWSLKRMVRLGYNTNSDRAIMSHNGTPGIPATVSYLAAVKNFAKGFSQLK